MPEKHLIGWREWLSLPDLNIPAIKAKVDTGARTSALHASAIEPYTDEFGARCIRFCMHPQQRSTTPEIWCTANVADQRMVTDSGGHKTLRYVIRTCISLHAWQWMAELTLTDRDTMRFRMLLGRRALHDFFLVDPSQSFLLGGNKQAPAPLNTGEPL
ncbi:conserved hypothetical protein [gamma proteobacterium HdN1]|nr:conserved hypothetical protein [gamma proteobacterium HdN1]